MGVTSTGEWPPPGVARLKLRWMLIGSIWAYLTIQLAVATDREKNAACQHLLETILMTEEGQMCRACGQFVTVFE